MLTVLALSWERPDLLRLTLDRLRRFGHLLSSSVQIKIGDQGSQNRKVIEVLKSCETMQDTSVTYFGQNIGIREGFRTLVDLSDTRYVLLLENDWALLPATRERSSVLELLEANPQIDYVRLRSIYDLDDYGHGSEFHNPWSVPTRSSDLRIVDQQGTPFFVAPTRLLPPTFNPTIYRTELIRTVLAAAWDDAENPTPLRSGEESFQELWRIRRAFGAQAYPGLFYHLGFHKGSSLTRRVRSYVIGKNVVMRSGIHPYAAWRRAMRFREVASNVDAVRELRRGLL